MLYLLKNDFERFGPFCDGVSSQLGAEMPSSGVRHMGALLQHISFLQRKKRCTALKRDTCVASAVRAVLRQRQSQREESW